MDYDTEAEAERNIYQTSERSHSLCTRGVPTLSSSVQDIGVGPSLLVAFLAGCGNVLITNPIWCVATRMQVSS